MLMLKALAFGIFPLAAIAQDPPMITNPNSMPPQMPPVQMAPGQPPQMPPGQPAQPGQPQKPEDANNPLNTIYSDPAPADITGSVMFRQADYERIIQIQEALINKRRLRAQQTTSGSESDIMEDILNKLNVEDENPAEKEKIKIADPASVYMSSILWRGEGNGTAWINKNKYVPGADLDNIKLISINEESALIAFTYHNPKNELQQLANDLEKRDGKTASLDLTKATQGKEEGDKLSNRDLRRLKNIVSVNVEGQMVTFRLRPHQSFDTINLRVVEGNPTPKPREEKAADPNPAPAELPVMNNEPSQRIESSNQEPVIDGNLPVMPMGPAPIPPSNMVNPPLTSPSNNMPPVDPRLVPQGTPAPVQPAAEPAPPNLFQLPPSNSPEPDKPFTLTPIQGR